MSADAIPDAGRMAAMAKDIGVAAKDLKTWFELDLWLKTPAGQRDDAFCPGFDPGTKMCKTDTLEAWYSYQQPAASKAAIKDVCEGKFGKLPDPDMFSASCKRH